MSHIVKIKTRVTDLAALVAACLRLGGAKQGTAALFAGQEANAQIVDSPG